MVYFLGLRFHFSRTRSELPRQSATNKSAPVRPRMKLAIGRRAFSQRGSDLGLDNSASVHVDLDAVADLKFAQVVPGELILWQVLSAM